MDNVFVFAVIFSFAVPEKHRYHVLFYGVVGALVFRFLFILAGSALLSRRPCSPRGAGDPMTRGRARGRWDG